jgi:hypothetical protein
MSIAYGTERAHLISDCECEQGQTDPEKLLSTSFVEWGTALVTSTTISPAWARVLFDPFLRQLVLRYNSVLV